MSDECEYLTHLKFPCSGYSIAYIFLEEVSIEEVEQMSVLQNFDLEALDGRRIYDGSIRKFDMFSSILETHLAWWPLCYIFAVLGAPNGIRVGAAKGRSCPHRDRLYL